MRLRSSLRLLSSSRLPFAFISPTHLHLRREFSITRFIHNESKDFFEYTSGRWLYNEALRLAERKRVFNVDGLRRLAAQSVGRSPDDIADFRKFAEGGCNRSFLITMHDGFRMIARIPYPLMAPKYYAVASEVATMDFLRSYGLPIPEVFGYSPVPENEAETEYIFMEYIRGTTLGRVRSYLDEESFISVLRQITQLESKMMSIDFPAGGSLYYNQDLENMPSGGKPGVPLKDSRFCVGPDTEFTMWFGRRSQLDVDRGPYENAESAIVKAAHKELTYLKQFGQPLLPFKRMRREAYKYQEQSPSDHIENLNRYLRIAPSIIPPIPALSQFRIRHPTLHPGSVLLSRSSDAEWRVSGLIGWHHTSILPLFLHAGVPYSFQNYDDPSSLALIKPSEPENLDELNEYEQDQAIKLYRRRFFHHHYVKSTEEYNRQHFLALAYPASLLRRRLFIDARNPWQGDTHDLKLTLVDALENWKFLAEEGTPFPIAFDPEDVRKTRKLEEKQKSADEVCDLLPDVVGTSPEREGWISTEHYELAMRRVKEIKETALAQCSTEEERKEIIEHWIFDDMDETQYE